MRKYVARDNAQKRVRYTNRFHMTPHVTRMKVKDGHFMEVLKTVKKSHKVRAAYIELGQMVLEIRTEDNVEILRILKEECGYTVCSELSAIDYLASDGEFEIFYQMLNMEKTSRVRLLARIREDQAIESIVPLFKMAHFAEREMYDMFGIRVNNHPYLKRILMPDDWEGHPLRKTYPLQGDEFAAWYEVDKIFGKEYREVVGPELRDPAMVDRYDTRRFARVGHEVPFGADPSQVDSQETPIEYSSDFLVDYNRGEHRILDERK